MEVGSAGHQLGQGDHTGYHLIFQAAFGLPNTLGIATLSHNTFASSTHIVQHELKRMLTTTATQLKSTKE